VAVSAGTAAPALDGDDDGGAAVAGAADGGGVAALLHPEAMIEAVATTARSFTGTFT